MPQWRYYHAFAVENICRRVEYFLLARTLVDKCNVIVSTDNCVKQKRTSYAHMNTLTCCLIFLSFLNIE